MRRRTISLGGLPSDVVVAGTNELFIDLIGPLEQEVGQEIGRIIGHIFAQVDESLSQVRYNLVHQVLPDWLGSLVEQVTFVFTDLLHLGSVT